MFLQMSIKFSLSHSLLMDTYSNWQEDNTKSKTNLVITCSLNDNAFMCLHVYTCVRVHPHAVYVSFNTTYETSFLFAQVFIIVQMLICFS